MDGIKLLLTPEVVVLVVFLIVVDIGLRWALFGKVESVSLDLCFFATAYHLSQLLSRTVGESPAEGTDRLVLLRLFTSAGALAILAGVHVHYNRMLEVQIRDAVDNASKPLQRRLEVFKTSEAKREALLKARELLVDHVPVVFFARGDSKAIRAGKRLKRQEAAELLRAIDPHRAHVQSDFLLPRTSRVVGAVVLVASPLIALGSFAITG